MLNGTSSSKDIDEDIKIAELEKKLQALLIESEKTKKEQAKLLRQNANLGAQVKTLNFAHVVLTSTSEETEQKNSRYEAMKRRRDKKLVKSHGEKLNLSKKL